MAVPFTIVQDTVPRTQVIAGLNQAIYSTDWTANVASDILVYNAPPLLPASDILYLVNSNYYTVSFIGAGEIVQVTFGAEYIPDQFNIITIVRNTASDWLNNYTNTNFTPSMLNSDFATLVQVDQDNTMQAYQLAPRYDNSAIIMLPNLATDTGGDIILPTLGPNQFWAKNESNTDIVAVTVPEGSAPDNSTYLVQTATPSLPSSFDLGTLASGLLKINVATGFATPEIATNGTDYWAPGDVLTIPGDPTSPLEVTDKNYVDNLVAANGGVTAGLINQLAWYAASGSTVSGLSTAASSILVTSAGGIPSLSTTLPAFSLGGTLNTAGNVITNSVTNGNLLFTTNGSGVLTINGGTYPQGVIGISNDPTMAADSAELLPTQSAVKAYANTVASGFTFITPSASAAQFTNFSGTYSNGTSGVGATITQTSAAIVVIDGVTISLNGYVLFGGQTSSFQNGLYNMTTAGTSLAQAVFTRSTTYDTTVQIVPGSLITVSGGTTYSGSIWAETSTVSTIGTDPITFTEFAQPSNTFVTLSTNQAITGIKTFGSGNLVLSGSSSGTSVLNAAAVAGSTTFTLPSTTDTLVGLAAAQTLTNKSISGATNTLSAIPYTALANGTAGNLITWSSGATPALVATGTAGQALISNGAGAAPTFETIPGVSYTAPTVQVFTSGSGTYTTPTGPSPLYLKVEMVGGGAGGNPTGTAQTAATNGASSLFGSALLTATGGATGQGTPGSGTINSPAYGFSVSGGIGGAPTSINNGLGGTGGATVFGGSGPGGYGGFPGISATVNSGAGGGGSGGLPSFPGATAGSSGGYVNAFIPSPSSTYSYTVGEAGAAGGAGAGGYSGGTGGSGIIIVTAYYQ